MKKTVRTLLFGAFAIPLVACGTSDDEGASSANGDVTAIQGQPWVFSPENPTTINMLIVSHQMAPNPGNRILQVFEDRFGITFNWEIVPPELQDQRIGVMLAAGAALPDLLGVTELDARLVQGGAMLRLDPFLDSGQWPRLLEHIAPYRGRLSFTHDDGSTGIYQFPNYNRFYTANDGSGPIMSPAHWGSAFWLQKSVLEWHGFPDLTNISLERYFDLIEQYMAAHPVIDGLPTIGFTFPLQGRTWGLTNPPMFLAGHPNNGGVIVRYDNQGGVYAELYAVSQYAQDYFRFLSYAFDRGLVDPETFSRTLDDYFAVLATGRVLGMHDQRWAFGTAYDALVAQGNYARTWAATMPVFEGRTPWYADRDVMNENEGFGLPIDSDNPEKMLSFLELLLDPEIQVLLSWGEYGIDFHRNAQGRMYRTPEQRAEQTDPTWIANNRLMALLDIMPKLEGSLPDGNAFAPGNQPEEFLDGISDYNRFFLESYGKSTWRDFMNYPPSNPVYYPAWQIIMPDASAAQMANAQLEEAALMWLPQIIMAPASEFDSLWAQYVAQVGLIDTAAVEEVITEGLMDRVRAAGGL